MKITRVAILGIAVVAGGVAAVLALNLTRQAAPPPEQVQQTAAKTDIVQVLVASADIPVGTTLTASSVSWQDWPKTGVNANFITKQPNVDGTAGVVGAIARDTFYAGEPINNAKLITSDQGFLSAILPQGMRAVATKIAADTSAGGFILPNDRVDVVMTRQNANADTSVGGGNSGATYSTQTILHNIRVLAIDQTVEEKDGQKVVVGQTATLELTPQQVEILTVAQQMSERLTLSLRSIADSTVTPADAAADAVDLLGGTKQHGAVTVIRNGVAHQETALH